MECLFCKINKGEIPSYTIYEDEIIKVFLDILYGNATIYLDRKYQRYLSLLELSRTWK